MTTSDVKPPPALPAARRLSRSRLSRSRLSRSRRPLSSRGPLAPAGVAVVATAGTVAVLAIWFVIYALVLSGLQESHAQHLMYSQLREELALGTAPIGVTTRPGTPIAVMAVPGIGLKTVVVEGTSSADLTKGPGHLPSSPLPGQAGNSVIYGRSATFGAPFGRVHDLRPGSMITITTGQGTFGFRVLHVRGPGDPVPSATDLGKSSLTLETSAGTGWRRSWAPNEVIYADARMVAGQVQAASAGRPSKVPGADTPLAGDAADPVLFSLFLWLLALLLLAGGLAYGYLKWTVWQLWFVGLPAVVALLWVVSNSVWLLLPNLA